MPSPTVVFSLTGDVLRNSRALKQLRALSSHGCTLEVLTFGLHTEKTWPEPNIRLHVLPRPSGHGPRFFARVHRLFMKAALRIPAAIYHASDLYTLPALYAAARRHHGGLVYDARERYPYVASTAGRPWVRWFWKRIEGRYIHRADAVFTVSESIANHIAQSYGIPKPTVLYNVPPRQAIPSSTYLRDHTGISNEVVLLLHQGSIQKDRGCFLLADAMRDVRGAALLFLGGGPLKHALQQYVVDAGVTDRVYFLDPVSPDELLPVTASADIGVTLLEDTCLNHRFALPNKLFEYLMAGLPVLGSDLPEIRKVINGFEVGRVVDPSNRDILVEALQNVVDDADTRTRWATHTSQACETFSWEKTSQDFIQMYQTLLSSRETP